MDAYLYLMIVFRAFSTAVFALMILLGSITALRACYVIGDANKDFWNEHASVIVDATLSDFSLAPLLKPGSRDESGQRPTTWLLELNVHGVLRGSAEDQILVATRFAQTTIVNRVYLANLLGKRREYALVELSGETEGAFASDSESLFEKLEDGFLPQHDGFHVFSSNGEPVPELWEGLCSAPPVFPLGTLFD